MVGWVRGGYGRVSSAVAAHCRLFLSSTLASFLCRFFFFFLSGGYGDLQMQVSASERVERDSL